MRIAEAGVKGQSVFRSLLAAMSRPGRVCTLPSLAEAGDDPWETLLLLLESLLDQEVGFAVIPVGDAEELESRIARRTGSRAVKVEEADFLVVAGGDSGGAVLRAKRGTLQYPDNSATIIYRLSRLADAAGGKPFLALTGPGIRGEILLGEIRGLGSREVGCWKECNRDFPLGVDAVLIDGEGRTLCLPRSTNIRMVES